MRKGKIRPNDYATVVESHQVTIPEKVRVFFKGFVACALALFVVYSLILNKGEQPPTESLAEKLSPKNFSKLGEEDKRELFASIGVEVKPGPSELVSIKPLGSLVVYVDLDKVEACTKLGGSMPQCVRENRRSVYEQ